jgi:hypothetical protein
MKRPVIISFLYRFSIFISPGTKENEGKKRKNISSLYLPAADDFNPLKTEKT